MRIVFGLILILGLGLAGFAVYMAQGRFNEYQSVVDTQKRALRNNVTLVRVFVAETELQYGRKLKKEDVRIVLWPENAIPEGAFTDPLLLFPDKENTLRTVLHDMEKDEVITAAKVTEPGEDAGVSSRLATGMRAFTIRVDVASGVSGFLRPGHRVDVYWSGRVGKKDVTKLILEDIQLIAIDQIADEDRNTPVVARTVTAEVSPRVVAALVQAQSTGRLLLSLRGAGDSALTGAIEIDQDQLLGIEQEVAQETTVAKVCTIKTRKGASVVIIPVACPKE